MSTHARDTVDANGIIMEQLLCQEYNQEYLIMPRIWSTVYAKRLSADGTKRSRHAHAAKLGLRQRDGQLPQLTLQLPTSSSARTKKKKKKNGIFIKRGPVI